MGYSLCGPVEAPALFYFHDQGTSHLQGLAFAESAKRIGVRVICPSRPGIGLSTVEPGRSLVDYPQQIVDLARRLGLNTYLNIEPWGSRLEDVPLAGVRL